MQHMIVLHDEQDYDKLVEIWEKAVRETHAFLAEEDVQFYRQLVRGGALKEAEIWTYRENDAPVGFIGLNGAKIETLFVHPDHHGKGIGRRLVEHAEARIGPALQVDVNEQNDGARGFYRRLGFVQTGRSELDGSGRPYPLLHLEKR